MKAIIIINYLDCPLFRSFDEHAKQRNARVTNDPKECRIYDYSEADEERILLCVNQKNSQPRRIVDKVLDKRVDRVIFGHRNKVEGGRLPYIPISNSEGNRVLVCLQELAEGKIRFDSLFENYAAIFSSEMAVPILSLFLPIDIEVQALYMCLQSRDVENGNHEAGCEWIGGLEEQMPHKEENNYTSRLNKGLLRVDAIYRGKNQEVLIRHIEDQKIWEFLGTYGQMRQILMHEGESRRPDAGEMIQDALEGCDYFHKWYLQLAAYARYTESSNKDSCEDHALGIDENPCL